MRGRRFLATVVAITGAIGAFGVGAASASTVPDAPATDGDATLRLGVRRQNTTLDPVFAPTSSEEQQLDMLYDRLFRVRPDGTIVGELVDEWEFTDDGLVMHVRAGVVFHDGAALDAEAVRVNLDRARTLEESTVKNDLAAVEAVEVVDDETVLLRMPERNVTIVPVLATRTGAMASPQAIADGVDLNLEPVGAGPYRLVEFVPGVGQTLERFEDYWNPDVVDVARVEIMVLSDAAARINAIRSGQLDLVELEPAQIAEAESVGLPIDETVLQTVISLQVSSTNVPAFADERVRQAMNFAIDREGIVQGLLGGHGAPASQYFSGPSIAHDPTLEDPYPYDPDRARELLAEAGFADGFEFTVNLGTGIPSIPEVEAVAGSLSDIGITMHIEQLPGNEPIQRMWTDQSGEALAFPGNTFIDPSLAFGVFLPENLRNPSNLTSDRVTELWQQSLLIEDPEERRAVLQEASRELTLHPLSVIPLYSISGAFAMTDDVVGFVLPANYLWNLRDVGIAA